MFGSLIADKTDWRKLLKGEAEPLNLIEQRDQLIEEFALKFKLFVKNLVKTLNLTKRLNY